MSRRCMQNKRSKIRQRKHRLEPTLYLGCQAIAFTICTRDRAAYFSNEPIFQIAKHSLQQYFSAPTCALVYCFMPDHVHLITIGVLDSFSPLLCLKKFKQAVTHSCRDSALEFHWQIGFYDHVIRSEENLSMQIEYLLNNPVRKGLAKHWQEWSGCGWFGDSIYFPTDASNRAT